MQSQWTGPGWMEDPLAPGDRTATDDQRFQALFSWGRCPTLALAIPVMVSLMFSTTAKVGRVSLFELLWAAAKRSAMHRESTRVRGVRPASSGVRTARTVEEALEEVWVGGDVGSGRL